MVILNNCISPIYFFWLTIIVDQNYCQSTSSDRISCLNRLTKMVLEGLGRFWEHTKGKLILYIPADVYKDSQFPFKPREQVKVTIDPNKNRMIIEKR